MKNDKFAVFILTHGRPNKVKTLGTLKRCGYTGEVYFILDDEDKTRDKYISNYSKEYGPNCIQIFNKKYFADTVDEGNNFDERRTITHARNACFDIATSLGIKYFVQLDDDYNSFSYRYERGLTIRNLDAVFESFLEYYKSIDCLSIAFSQGGDHIGGFSGVKLKRKCMNSFFCSTDRRFQFIGAMNEDVNTYTTLGSRGHLFLTFTPVQLNQEATQSQKSGITDMYLRFGTYCKAFTTVMMMPSSVKVSMMTSKYERLHHSIDWATTVPLIISERFKKI
jgi:hypothetical protein